MATKSPLIPGSRFCRDCGGRTTAAFGVVVCENTTWKGKQQSAQDRCAVPGAADRRYCEHCGADADGRHVCGRCGEYALDP